MYTLLYDIIGMLLALSVQVFIVPEYLLMGFGLSLAGIMYCLYLETPDHVRLKSAVQELQEARAQELSVIREAEEANNIKTNFLINVSHELRTPINAVFGFGEMIYNESDDDGCYRKRSSSLQCKRYWTGNE